MTKRKVRDQRHGGEQEINARWVRTIREGNNFSVIFRVYLGSEMYEETKETYQLTGDTESDVIAMMTFLNKMGVKDNEVSAEKLMKIIDTEVPNNVAIAINEVFKEKMVR